MPYDDILCKEIGPDQARQNVRSDLDPNSLTLCHGMPERIFQKVNLEKNQIKENHENFLSMQTVNKYLSEPHFLVVL